MTVKLTNTLHTLKLDDVYKEPIKQGIKTFELRYNKDRNYQVGDRVCFKGISTIYVITYVLKNVPQFGLKQDYCIFAFRKLRDWEIKEGEIIL